MLAVNTTDNPMFVISLDIDPMGQAKTGFRISRNLRSFTTRCCRVCFRIFVSRGSTFPEVCWRNLSRPLWNRP